MERPAFTLGVEEEFQIIDPETRELRSHVQEILEEGKLVLKERVKPEMHQSVIEIGTGICKNIAGGPPGRRRDAHRDHPPRAARTACAWPRPARTRSPTGPTRRSSRTRATTRSSQEMQLLARANLIFGLHVHVGIEDRALAFQIMNEALLLPAAHARALDELAVLARAATRA